MCTSDRNDRIQALMLMLERVWPAGLAKDKDQES